MELAELLREPPRVHRGGTLTWGISPAVLQYLWEAVSPGMRTAETGLGMSTMVFALRRAQHTTITPSHQEIDLLRTYCAEKTVPLDGVTFVARPSQDYLPTMTGDLDLAVVDGGHGMPLPFLDWFYFAQRLRTGGLMVIDDTQLWTGYVLQSFLQEEPGWSLVKGFPKTSVFRLDGEFAYSEWYQQPFVERRSRYLKPRHLVKRMLHRLTGSDAFFRRR